MIAWFGSFASTEIPLGNRCGETGCADWPSSIRVHTTSFSLWSVTPAPNGSS